MSKFLQNIQERAQQSGGRIVFPEIKDKRVVEAAKKLVAKGQGQAMLVHPIGSQVEKIPGIEHVVIDEERAKKLAKLLVELRGHRGMTLQEATTLSHDPLVYGMYLVREGDADGIVAGAERKTADVVRAGLWLIDKEPGIKTISSAFYMLVPPFRGGEPEVLTFADCGIVEVPTTEQLADIAISAADARRRIVGDEPRVAFLSFSTKGSGGSGESITRMQEAIRLVKERRPDIAIAEHELQGDAALIEAVAERKVSGSTIAGKANVLIFPSLDAGNIAYKLVRHLVPGAYAVGPIGQGFKADVAVNDTSRGATWEEIYYSALIAILSAKKK